MQETQSSLRKHPFDAIPFEAFHRGSWIGVSRISIKNGSLSAQFNHHGSVAEDKIRTDYIRLRSRKAGAFDCLHLLKPGVDVCVLSAHRSAATSDRKLQKPLLSRHDAKIISIKRASHADRCACLFSVVVYRSKDPTVLRKSTLDRGVEVVTIDNIAILQNLSSDPCEDGHYQWTSSEDCISSSKSKLLSGTFSSEISWLVVLSTLKGMNFDIKLVQNKIVHVLNSDQGLSSIPDALSDGDNHKLSSNSDKNTTVILFQMCTEILLPKIGSFVTLVSKEMTVPVKMIEVDPIARVPDSDSDVEILYDHTGLRHSKRRKMVPDRFVSSFSPKSDCRSIRNVLHDIGEFEQQKALTANDSGSCLLIDKELYPYKLNDCMSGSCFEHGEPSSIAEVLQIEYISEDKPSELCSKYPVIIDPESICGDQHKNIHSSAKLKGFHGRVQKERKISLSHNIHHLPSRTDQKRCSHRKKLLSATECMQLIEMCMGNIKFEMERQTQHVPQWIVNQPISILEGTLDFNWSPSSGSPVENDEHRDLWKEMDHSLTTLALLERKQESNWDFFDGTADISNKDGEKPCQHDYKLNEKIGQVCQKCNCIIEIGHVLPPFLQGDGWARYKEKFTIKEKSWMGPHDLRSDPFNKASSWEISHSEGYENVWTLVPDLKSKLHLHQKNAFEFIWRNIAGSLMPEEMNHLSENAGGCVISHSPGSGKTLLIISFLVSYLKLFPKIRPLILCPKITVYIWCKEFDKWGFPFPVYQIHPIESYKKEMWNCETKMSCAHDRKPNRKMMHAMDCLEKLRQWHEHPSILLMSYSSFFSLAREDSSLEYRKFMAGMLQQSPGILILDEGHNPRSTKSKLRKLLMKVNTEFRILLSGTLFQNNFEEYFNTLSLARPCFIDDAISKLDPNMVNIFSNRKKKQVKKLTLREKLARKLFVEEVGQKIESSMEDDRKQGFDLLNKITSGFIDVYEGATSDTLPGLQIYILLLASTDLQQEILEKLQNSIKNKRCPLELELLITVGSIHPWLIKTVACVSEYFNAEVLEKIEQCKGNFSSGSKAKFVIDLVHKSTLRGERVLIFCHNISPINLLVELFEIVFGWCIREEVLVLKGDQELSERAKIMEKFNGDDKGRCKVLLASTTACSEGINLVAASRVILLDSEWNHAKTTQAIARAFRPGQERDVYVYRLLASGTWEEDKYNSNAWKSWLSKMIFIGKYFKYSPSRQVEDIDDEILRELVEEDPKNSFQRITRYD